MFYALKIAIHIIGAIVKVIAHWVLILIRNVRTFKNKYDLALCQSRLHTTSEIFVRQKSLGLRTRKNAWSHRTQTLRINKTCFYAFK